MTRKICCVFLTLSVLIFIGAGCRDSKMVTDAKVVFSNTLKGNFFFQPESKTAYDKVAADSTGKYQFVAEIQEPTFFRYVGVKQGFYSVYLTPGANVEIVESENGVEFKGDWAAENTFLAENRYIGISKEGIESYSAEWLEINSEEIKRLIAKLEASGLDNEFIHLQGLKYKYDFYNQLLFGPANAMMFAHMNIKLPEHYYDFAQSMTFTDSAIVQIPKWFTVMLGVFERGEKEGWIEVSPEHYMEIYAKKIEDEKVRSLFLVKLLDHVLQKGYSDDFPVYIESVRPFITHAAALEELPSLEARYRASREAHKTILRGEMAPEFKAVDINGKEYSSADFKGKIQVLDFWFTGCIPCRAEMPYMEKLADDMQGENIVFIAMSVDTGDELMALWREMVKDKRGAELQLNLPGGFKSDLVKKYLIHGVPRIVIVDKEGKIVDANAKRPSDPKLRMLLERLI